MKEIFLQFPSYNTFSHFIRMVDVSDCTVGWTLFTVMGKIQVPEIDMAVRDFNAKAIEYQLAEI